jgi:hypothetical protein
MEKTAKITRVVFKNEYNGQHGKVFYHDVELDNGDKGSIGCKDKEPTWLNPNQELCYTLDNGKIKKVQPQNGSGGGKKPFVPVDPRIQFISFSMSYAKDLCVAGKIDDKKLISTFELIYDKMEEKYKKLTDAK